MITYSFDILGHKWTSFFVTNRAFNKKYGKETLAIAECDDKELFFRPKVSYETVVHELLHAYMWELCVTNSDMTIDQQEEVFADLMSKYGQRLLGQASELLIAQSAIKQAAKRHAS